MDILNKMLNDFYSNNRVVNFFFSIGYFYELTKENVNVFLWQIDENTIYIASEKEYEMNLKNNIYDSFYTGIKKQENEIIYIVDDKDTAYKIYEVLSQNNVYEEKVNSLIKVLKNQPLKLDL